jgi:XTP/dITP diphosphohydrolase
VTDLLVATNNPGKLGEFRRLLAHLPARVIGPADIGLALDVPEPHFTYAQNAADKARAFCAASGLLTVADDSGIEVAALDGGPGVRSARYGGAGGGAAYLLTQLPADADRAARMVCWLAVAVPSAREPHVELFNGTVSGQVAAAPRGERGFGYDPIFELPDGRTTAELDEGEKDRISHRGQAVQAATPFLLEALTA